MKSTFDQVEAILQSLETDILRQSDNDILSSAGGSKDVPKIMRASLKQKFGIQFRREKLLSTEQKWNADLRRRIVERLFSTSPELPARLSLAYSSEKSLKDAEVDKIFQQLVKMGAIDHADE